MAKDLLPLEVRENTLKQVSEFLSRKPSGLPLDPEGDMNVFTASFLFLPLLCFSKFLLRLISSLFRSKVAHTKKQSVV